MTREELAAALAYGNTCVDTKKQAREVVEFIFETIKNALLEGDTVTLHKFGVFNLAKFKARTGVSPKGQKYTAPEQKVPKFKASKSFKQKAKNVI